MCRIAEFQPVMGAILIGEMRVTDSHEWSGCLQHANFTLSVSAPRGGKPRDRHAACRDQEREIARLWAELQKKRQIITEVVEENLALRGGSRGAHGDMIQCHGQGGTVRARHACQPTSEIPH